MSNVFNNRGIYHACGAPTPRNKTYWHFNTHLLKVVFFCEQFVKFWEEWHRGEEHLGKVQVKMFCQQCASFSSARVRGEVQILEEDITALEQKMLLQNDPDLGRALQQKKRELAGFLNERVK